MAKIFQLNKNDKINDYDVNRACVSSNSGHTDYDVLVKRATNDIASYQLFYRDVYHTGYKQSLVYMLTNINDSIDEVYLTNIHAKELKVVAKQNKGLKIAHSIIDKGFIRDVFHWKTLGYKIVGFDDSNVKIKNLINKLQRVISRTHSIDDTLFEQLFNNPSFDFASKCKEVMEHIVIPAPILDESNKNLHGIKASYICIKEL